MHDQKNHVRLKPHNPAAGHVKRVFGAPWGFSYKAGVWYTESDELAPERCAYLSEVRMNSCDDFSPKAFNICTRAEAEQIKLYEESGELEKVINAARPPGPQAPTTEGAAAASHDLNLPAPKSELAAAASAAATKLAEKQEETSEKPAVAKTPKATKRSYKTRRKTPGR